MGDIINKIDPAHVESKEPAHRTVNFIPFCKQRFGKCDYKIMVILEKFKII